MMNEVEFLAKNFVLYLLLTQRVWNPPKIQHWRIRVDIEYTFSNYVSFQLFLTHNKEHIGELT